MAIFHLSTKPISRSSGRSSTASAAYRAACKIEDKRTGLTHDYSKKQGVVFSQCIVADKYHEIIEFDRSELWNIAEKAEKRKDARTAREIIINLPHELNDEIRKTMVYDFALYLINEYDVAVDYSIHRPDLQGDQRNHHCHIMMTTRAATYENKGIQLSNKTRLELSNTKLNELNLPKSQTQIKDIRERWAFTANTYLKIAKSNERIDHRSFAERGIDKKPTIKLGWQASALERKNKKTRAGDVNRQVKLDNNRIEKLKNEIEELKVEQQKKVFKDSILSMSDLDTIKIDSYDLTELRHLQFYHDKIKEKLESDISSSIDLLRECNAFIERADNFNATIKERTEFSYKSDLVSEYKKAFEQSAKLYKSFDEEVSQHSISDDARMIKSHNSFIANYEDTKAVIQNQEDKLAVHQAPVLNNEDKNESVSKATNTFKP